MVLLPVRAVRLARAQLLIGFRNSRYPFTHITLFFKNTSDHAPLAFFCCGVGKGEEGLYNDSRLCPRNMRHAFIHCPQPALLMPCDEPFAQAGFERVGQEGRIERVERTLQKLTVRPAKGGGESFVFARHGDGRERAVVRADAQ